MSKMISGEVFEADGRVAGAVPPIGVEKAIQFVCSEPMPATASYPAWADMTIGNEQIGQIFTRIDPDLCEMPYYRLFDCVAFVGNNFDKIARVIPPERVVMTFGGEQFLFSLVKLGGGQSVVLIDSLKRTEMWSKKQAPEQLATDMQGEQREAEQKKSRMQTLPLIRPASGKQTPGKANLNWWPYPEHADLIPALRSLGRKGIRPVQRVGGCEFEFPKLTLAEQKLNYFPPYVQVILSSVLADGVKLFEMPLGMEGLEQIELSIPVADFTPPFPAQIVRTPAGDYHFVVKQNGLLMIAKFEHDKTVDLLSCFRATRPLEEYLTSGFHNHITGKDEERNFEHRFRSTLNFLQLCTCEGIICDGRQPLRKNQKRSLPMKAANPERYKIQSIKLFSKRTRAALESAAGCGNSKRPHHRRSHWRNAAVGPGRTGHKLILIPATFINRGKIDDIGDIDYFASA